MVPLDADLVLLTARLTVRSTRNRSPLQSAELPGLEGPSALAATVFSRTVTTQLVSLDCVSNTTSIVEENPRGVQHISALTASATFLKCLSPLYLPLAAAEYTTQNASKNLAAHLGTNGASCAFGNRFEYAGMMSATRTGLAEQHIAQYIHHVTAGARALLSGLGSASFLHSVLRLYGG